MRPTKDQYFIAMAHLVAYRSTCLRRHVGAVAVNARGHVLSTGYNGVAAGLPHCNEAVIVDEWLGEKEFPHACAGADAPSGQALDACQALHAEQNLVLQARDVYAIDTVYCTASPCMSCIKLLLNTSCRRLVFSELYPHSEALELWERAGREWLHLPFEDLE